MRIDCELYLCQREAASMIETPTCWLHDERAWRGRGSVPVALRRRSRSRTARGEEGVGFELLPCSVRMIVVTMRWAYQLHGQRALRVVRRHFDRS